MKKSAHEALQDFPDIRWKWWSFRWEFMRRDPAYLATYQEALKLRQEAGLTPDDTLQEGRIIRYSYFETSQGDRERLLASEFFGRNPAAAYMLDPSRTLDELFPERRDRAFFLGGDREKAVQLYRQMPRKVPKNTVLMAIDITQVNSKDSLKKYLNAVIDSFLMQFQVNQTEKMKNFDRYLKIGDMRKKGRKWDEIAEILFSEDENPESSDKKAKFDHKQFKRLINGGWRKLKYP